MLRHYNAGMLTFAAVELQAILQSIPEALYVGTADGIKLANQPALTMLGFKTADELNHAIGELAERIQTRYVDSGEVISAEDQGFSHALQGRPLTREVVVRHIETGEDRVLRSAAAPVIVDGKVIAAVAVNTDITEAKRNELSLEQAVRDRDDMLAVVSHDLRNMVTVMTTALAYLGLREGRPDDREVIETAMATARSMTDLIEDLLEVTTLEGGHFSMEARPESPRALLRTAYERFQPLAAKKSMSLLLAESESPLPPVLADPRRIHQVFSNLIANALKFSHPGTSITIDARLVDGEVRFSVADCGTGIEPEALPHVFDRFYQARANKTRGSVGLGLAIARGIVEAHGGRIWVESEPGKGSTFFFTVHAVKGSDRLAQVD